MRLALAKFTQRSGANSRAKVFLFAHICWCFCCANFAPALLCEVSEGWKVYNVCIVVQRELYTLQSCDKCRENYINFFY